MKMRASRVTLSELGRVERGTTWLTERQACELLGLDAAQLYRDAELLVGCKLINNEVMFDGREVVERVDQGDARSTNEADELIAELRASGLAPHWLQGGDAA